MSVTIVADTSTHSILALIVIYQISPFAYLRIIWTPLTCNHCIQGLLLLVAWLIELMVESALFYLPPDRDELPLTQHILQNPATESAQLYVPETHPTIAQAYYHKLYQSAV